MYSLHNNSFRNSYERDLYSPKYSSMDTWGMSSPSHLYGPLKNDEMVAPFHGIQHFTPQLTIDKNYELLTMQSGNGSNSFDDEIYAKISSNDEHFAIYADYGKYKYLIILVLFLFIFYIFDKSFGKKVEGLSLWTKSSIIMIFTFLILYLMFLVN
uniref:Uncharacterized protein n=1 Tax=viral metagenome TaxID=1070528 RepID=A0A6C0JSJ4_9ZZZZ